MEQLVRTWQDSLTGLAYRWVGVRSDAEEAVQETFIRLWRKAHQIEAGETALRRWVIQVLQNVCWDMLRSRTYRRTVREAVPYETLENVVAERDEIDLVNTRMVVENALAQMPVIERDVVLLRAEGFKISEIAAMLHIPEGTVKARANRAKMVAPKTRTAG